MLAVRAHDNDEQAKDDGHQEETPIAANSASGKAAVENNAIEIDGTSPEMAFLASEVVPSDSELTCAVAVRELETKGFQRIRSRIVGCHRHAPARDSFTRR